MNDNAVNHVLRGDCLELAKSIKPGSVDLIYLDPPFFTGKNHSLATRKENKVYSFTDIWNSNQEYTEYIGERIAALHGLLCNTGSIFVHCNRNSEHIIRAILNTVFGEDNFQSEIVWSYKRWSNSKKGLLPGHQNIYFYSKSNQFKFNTLSTEYSVATNVDQILQRRTRNKHGKSAYERDDNGNFKHGGEKKGVPLSDVWDIPYLNPKAKERVGYPTQKPVILLERIIDITTDVGDLVLDPFCGSGTTCVAAKLLDRNYIGFDISNEAVDLAIKRLEHPIKTESKLLKMGRHSYRNADEQTLSLLSGIPFNPVQRNKGIDAILIRQYRGTPILVRIQKKGESLIKALGLLKNAMTIKRSLKGILIQTKAENSPDNSYVDKLCGEEITLMTSPALQINDLLKAGSPKDRVDYNGRQLAIGR